ncbi:hypothetical protein GDO78_020570 [Eleutherodactylus coqui]|uniref:Uncharacterized protein n=1 Tax=Eleutherodactylus coqui TaxID=57060 RepID=A0A8J6EBP9_ELECQ|nr:hypothetical protein GDO78_020570 [Eleutherodactylus coqui]
MGHKIALSIKEWSYNLVWIFCSRKINPLCHESPPDFAPSIEGGEICNSWCDSGVVTLGSFYTGRPVGQMLTLVPVMLAPVLLNRSEYC